MIQLLIWNTEYLRFSTRLQTKIYAILFGNNCYKTLFILLMFLKFSLSMHLMIKMKMFNFVLLLQVMCLESIGIIKCEKCISMILRLDQTQPVSDEYVTVTDTEFVDIPVRLYLPKRKSETPRRAVIYIHGGGFCLGSFSKFLI